MTITHQNDQNPAPTNRGVKLPTVSSDQGSESLICIGYDWIEYSGKKQIEFLNSSRLFRFQVEDTDKDFIKKISYMTNSGSWEECATLKTDLKVVRDKSWCQVKLNNKFCYQPQNELVDFIKAINQELGIHFMNFTRIDIAADFQRTDYRNLMPQNFLDNVAKKKYVFARKQSRQKSMKESNLRYSVTSAMVGQAAADKLQQKAHTDGYNSIAEIDAISRLGQTQTIRVGSRKSGLSITMYNKSLEMRKGTNKTWIKEHWDRSGMLEGFDVFRLEFQHMKDVKDIVFYSPDTGEETHRISHANIDSLLYLEDYFRYLYKRHFCVAIYEKGVRFSRMKKVDLLKVDKPLATVERTSEKLKSTNYIKSHTKKLLQDAITEYHTGSKLMASELFRYAQRQIELHDLHNWKEKYFPDVSFKDSVITYFDELTTTYYKTDLLKSTTLLQPSFFNGEVLQKMIKKPNEN